MTLSDLLTAQSIAIALPSLGIGAIVTFIAIRIFSSLKATPQAMVDHLLARRLATFETTLARVDAARDTSANNIWSLTGAFNLFGPSNPVELKELQTAFRDWYFAHGQMVTEDAKGWYFRMMEVLGALDVSGVVPRRPPPRQLYAGYADTLSVLRAELSHVRQALGGEVTERAKKNAPNWHDTTYQGRRGQPRLDRLVVELKIALHEKPDRPETATLAWLTAQELMSRLRSVLVRDLGWRGSFGLI